MQYHKIKMQRQEIACCWCLTLDFFHITQNMGDEETSHLENRPQVSSPVAPMVPVAEEHRRLFGYRPPNNSRATAPALGTENSLHLSVMQWQHRQGSHKHTYSEYTEKKHLCVWKKKQPLPLQLLRRYRWFWPGSKRKAYSFSKEVTASMCTRKFEAFPTLETAGGYEIPRTGERGNRQLMVLSIPPGGYTVLYLKATTASAKRYKRPLRRTKCLHTFIRTGANAGGCFSFSCQILQR